jgi:metal-dependent amidase/aminoacylase/carboxypeptidase family protein
MVTNNNMSAMYINNAASLGRSVVLPGSNGHRVVGSTDMGNISHLVPSIHPMIASAPSGTAIHTTAFEKASRSLQADQAVIDGAKIMAMTAIDYWISPQQQTAISAEFALTNPSRDVL